LEYQIRESNKLFLPLPIAGNKATANEKIKYTIHHFTKQVKSIDKQFLCIHQIRASVITNWLKTCGLRRTQYLAGHNNISLTEQYKVNNIDSLSKNINNLHPF
jgi:integrase/recombinase XerD